MPFTKDGCDLADVITSMTWGELRDVASDLSEMVKSAREDRNPFDLETPFGFCQLLWYWAEQRQEAAAEAAQRTD